MPLPLIGHMNFHQVQLDLYDILLNEANNQASLDPTVEYKVYREHHLPLEQIELPTVILRFISQDFKQAKSSLVTGYDTDLEFILDLYARGSAKRVAGCIEEYGHLYAMDRLHLLISQVVNTLLAAENFNLQKENCVIKDRWLNGVEIFQPDIGERPIDAVVAARIRFMMRVCETTYEQDGTILVGVDTNLKTCIDNEIVTDDNITVQI